MSGLGRVVRSGVARRPLHTAVLALTAMVAVAASSLAAGLLVASHAPFERAFDQQQGAHLQVDFDAAAPTDRLAATATLPGVVAAAGPFTTAEIRTGLARRGDGPDADGTGALDLGLLTVVGRTEPRAPVDRVSLTAGRWPSRAGELVLDPRGLAINLGQAWVGMRLHAAGLGGETTLTVVGLARSVTHTADGWATPETVAQLGGPTVGHQMLYRWTHADTDVDLVAARQAIAAAVPPRAITGTATYLAVRQALTANAAAFVPFVTAFGILALLLSVLVVGMVVAGTVASARRRIGILKAIGLTPWQLARGYAAQSLIPTLVGVAVGTGAALLLARPVLAELDEAYGSSTPTLPVGIVAAVAGAVLVLVALAAAAPALRIARRPASAVLHPGREFSGRPGGRWFSRRLATVPLPRSITLGIGTLFHRPARSLAMALVVFLGAICLTFAAGLASSLGAVQHSRQPLAGGDIHVGPAFREMPDPAGADTLPAEPVLRNSTAVRQAIAEMPSTRAFFGVTYATVDSAGRVGGTDVVGVRGDASFTHHEMLAGHWLTGVPGEAVLPTRALRAAGLAVGDSLTLTLGDRQTAVTVVGEVFDLTHDGMRLYTSAATLRGLGLDSRPDEFVIALRPGADSRHYVDSLNAELRQWGGEADRAGDGSSSVLRAMNVLSAALAAILIVVTGIGVLNTVLLQTRERAREIGVVRALGMTPWQTVTMALTSASAVGLVAGAAGVPFGIMLHHAVVPTMGATAGAVLAPSQVAVYGIVPVIGVLVGVLVVALLGAAGPAGRAARASSATVLRTE